MSTWKRKWIKTFMMKGREKIEQYLVQKVWNRNGCVMAETRRMEVGFQCAQPSVIDF